MDKKLIEAAKNIMTSSYSPYSSYKVGCAIFTDKGIFTGANVENSSFGATICAERVAACAAINAGSKTFIKMAVVSKKTPEPMPCGICLQFLSEFAQSDFEIITVCQEKNSYLFKQLLPKAFNLK